MQPEMRIPTHPGVVLLSEFLEPLGITQVAFAQKLDIPIQRVNEIVNGKRGITVDTAVRFAKALKTSAEFWLNLQNAYDLGVVRQPKLPYTRVLATRAARMLGRYAAAMQPKTAARAYKRK